MVQVCVCVTDYGVTCMYVRMCQSAQCVGCLVAHVQYNSVPTPLMCTNVPSVQGYLTENGKVTLSRVQLILTGKHHITHGHSLLPHGPHYTK